MSEIPFCSLPPCLALSYPDLPSPLIPPPPAGFWRFVFLSSGDVSFQRVGEPDCRRLITVFSLMLYLSGPSVVQSPRTMPCLLSGFLWMCCPPSVSHRSGTELAPKAWVLAGLLRGSGPCVCLTGSSYPGRHWTGWDSPTSQIAGQAGEGVFGEVWRSESICVSDRQRYWSLRRRHSSGLDVDSMR